MAADQPVNERGEPERERHEARPVGPARDRRLRLGDLSQSDDQREHADRHIHEEDPPPGQPTGQGPAEHRSDRHGDAGDRAEHSERDSALARREGVGEQRQRGREHDRAADALEGAGQREEGRVGGEAAEGGPDREHDDADREHQPSPDQVAIDPAVSRNAASVSAYASMTHCRSASEAWNACWMYGSATLTIVMSSNSMNTPVQTASRVHHLRAIGATSYSFA